MNKQWEHLECRGKQGNLTSRCSVGLAIMFTAGYPCWLGSTVNWMVLRTQGWARNDHISLGSLWRAITQCNWGTRKLSAELAARALSWQLLCLRELVEMGECFFFWVWGKKVNGTLGKAVRNVLLLLMLAVLVAAVYASIYCNALKRLSKLYSYKIIREGHCTGDDF